MVQYAESWLELEKSMGGARPCLKGSIEEIKQQYDDLVAMLAPSMPAPSPAVEAKDGEVDGVKYRVYTPVDAVKSGPLPVGVYTHGGGMACGNLDSEDILCRAVAEHTPSIVVSVDYRLTPEHKGPAQFMDSLAVYKWAWYNASSIGGDQSKFFSIGGSAGGTLALALANFIVAKPEIRSHIAGCVAIVPATLHWDNVPSEYAHMYKAYTENASDVPIIDKSSMETFYTALGADPKDANTFVALNTENHKNFPPTYICTCEADPLRDDGKVMEEALKKAGVPVKSDFYPGLPHYFWIFPSIPEGQQFVGNLIGGCKWVVSQMK